MPEFPTYHGPSLPETLNPLNPKHYWLLFMWVFFQPSRLKHYLHRADPDLYRAGGREAMGKTLRSPAYRNVYLMAFLLTIATTMGVVGVVSAAQGTPIGVAFGVAGGATVGAAFGVASGVAVSMVGIMAVVAAVVVAFSLALVVSFGAAGGVVGAAGGVAALVAFGVAGGAAFGAAFSVAGGAAFGAVFGAAGGAAGGVAGGAGGSRFVFYVVAYPLAWRLSRRRGDPGVVWRRHPVAWDEYAVWPLPGVVSLLCRSLTADWESGLARLSDVAANPFHRWAAQRALSDFLTAHDNPLAVLYRIAHAPALAAYLMVPAERRQFREWLSARVVLLGEVGQIFADATGGESEASEWLAWRATRRLRYQEATPLAPFSAMLHDLFSEAEELETQPAQAINLAERFAPAYEGVRPFPHGDEIADSFATIAHFLALTSVEEIAAAPEALRWSEGSSGSWLRPAVVEALKALGDVGREAASYTEATSAGRRAAALNRAAGALEELERYAAEEVLPPERVLLARIVDSWASLIASEQGKLGEAALREMSPAARRAAGVRERQSAVWRRPATPIDNPYVVGDPVYPPLLVGRTDIFNRIDAIWSAKANPDSIILYGHRRMGKSSILRNLAQVAPPGSLIVYADMAGETSFVASTADLLLNLADRIYGAARRAYPAAPLPEPDPAAYADAAAAQFQFSRLAGRVQDALAGSTLVLALDEFEAIENAVEAGKIGVEIYQFLRTKTQEPWLTLVFGGLHTLDEMSRDYQQPFYGSYSNIRVSYLDHDEAWRLITNPTEDFDLNYEPAAVERIIAESGGQPYLVQQLCRDALDNLNHELFDRGKEREVKVLVSDVEAALGSDFFRRGAVYFDGVWKQAARPAQRALLRLTAQREAPWTLSQLEAASHLPHDVLRQQLRWAERHDILHKAAGDPPTWSFHVPLMRRWINRSS